MRSNWVPHELNPNSSSNQSPHGPDSEPQRFRPNDESDVSANDVTPDRNPDRNPFAVANLRTNVTTHSFSDAICSNPRSHAATCNFGSHGHAELNPIMECTVDHANHQRSNANAHEDAICITMHKRIVPERGYMHRVGQR